MSTLLFANNAQTTLGSSLSNSATTMTVSTGTGTLFPSPAAGQYFVVTLLQAETTTSLPNEVIWVTAVSGDTFTILRAQEGTTALAWSVGDIVANQETAGQMATLTQRAQLQVQGDNYAVDTGTKNAGVVTLSYAPVSLASITGSPIRVKKSSANQDANYTLNINSFGATAVLLPGGGQLPANTLAANSLFDVSYDGTNLELLSLPSLVTPTGPAGGDLTGTYPSPTVANNAITNAKLAQAVAKTFKMNNSGSTANVIDGTVAQAMTLLGFSVSLGTSGSQLLPGGLIAQWGTQLCAVTGSGINGFITALPRSFPNNHLWCIANWSGNLPPTPGAVSVSSLAYDVNNIQILINQAPSGSNSYLIAYLCIGD